MLKQILNLFLIFQLIIGQNFLYAEDPQSYQRTNAQIDAFMKTASPSDIPFVEYMENFVKSNTKPVQNYDLSPYIGKKAFIAYGVFDKGQNFCKYVEKPDLGTEKIEDSFQLISKFNNRSYAMAPNQMSYGACLDLTNKFGGYPVVITSDAENAYISSRFNGVKWLGMERNSCTEPFYSKEGREQEYFKWSSTLDKTGGCNPDELYVSQNQYGTWLKVNDDSLRSCVIEVDSTDIHRPLKICAPWWRIEREYEKERQTMYSGIDIYAINQADIPENLNVCVKYQDDVDFVERENRPPRQVTCTSYYDRTIAPECIKDIEQPICYVDECQGYIKNACRLKQTLSPLKPYTKIQVNINGKMEWVMGKDKIKTHVYDCPPSPPSIKKCETKSSIVIFPKECPGSQCEALKTCIFNSPTNTEKQACGKTHPCEKIYGNPDLPVFDSGTNELTGVEGYCKDGVTKLFFPANLQDKDTKKCLKYDTYDTVEKVSQKCVLERGFADYTVDTSVTQTDIYMNNPDCIRLNNLVQTRPVSAVTLNYTTNGFAKNVMKKALINGTNEELYSGGDTAYFDKAAKGGTNILGQTSATSSVSLTMGTPTITADPTCDIFTSDWYARNQKIFTLADGVTFDTSVAGLYQRSDSSAMYAKFYNIANATDCTAKKTAKGGLSTVYDPVLKICEVNFSVLNADKFRVIKGDDPSTMITKNAISKATCSAYATCFDGIYNTTSYASASLSECEITSGDNISAVSESAPEPIMSADECIPLPAHGFYQTHLDGTQDIFSVQEVTGGEWGYYSNYSSHPYKHNFISIDGKEIMPLKDIPRINDPLIYSSSFTQTSIIAKGPYSMLAPVFGGNGGGMATLILVATIFLAPVAIIMLIVFGKKKYNEQKGFWIVYKLVSPQRYIQNPFNYDHRILDVDANGVPKLHNGKYKLTYWTMDWFTGTQKPGDFTKMLQTFFSSKSDVLSCGGWFRSEVPKIPVETGVVVGYPSCKWYELYCIKKNTGTFAKNIDPFNKRMNNVYMGATNSVTIVVPYLGDYELKAYDKNDNLLASSVIKEGEFLQTSNDKAKYAQAMFGLRMDIADGVGDGTTTKACRYDLMTEWGGGTSGIYYENDTTGMYSGCSKSNDAYVRDHAATKITVRPLNVAIPFNVILDKPNPFPNRIFLATLNQKEIRKYRCYQPFADCLKDNYQDIKVN